jgi:hypothetical protein
MRASGQRRQIRPAGIIALLGALAFGSLAFGALGCGGSTPMDQWITMNPEAGAGFEVPVREVIPRSDGGVDSGADDDGGTVTDVATTADDATGSSDTGDSDAAAGAD